MTDGTAGAARLDGAVFRRVLGHYPTGVCVVTALPADGPPAALVVGSFSSVSLEPPLVAFFPDRRSRSWPGIERAGRYRISVLCGDQRDVCRRFAASGGDKFAGTAVRLSPFGSPVIENVLAWIECTLDTVHPAGDHFIVIGRVVALDVERDSGPLLFFRGGYGDIAPHPADAPL